MRLCNRPVTLWWEAERGRGVNVDEEEEDLWLLMYPIASNAGSANGKVEDVLLDMVWEGKNLPAVIGQKKIRFLGDQTIDREHIQQSSNETTRNKGRRPGADAPHRS